MELHDLVNESYYHDKSGMLLYGDCLDWMPKIPDKSIDMILCDVPYGTTQCKWDIIIPFDKMWKNIKRIRKSISSSLIFGSEPFSSALRISNLNEYKYDWIWVKNQPTGIGYAKYRPMSNSENISVFIENKSFYNPQSVKSKISDRSLGKSNGIFTGTVAETTGMMAKKKDNPNNILREDVKPRTVLEFKVVPHSKGYLHPTQKPVELLEYLIKTYTNEGNIVLDFASGSSSLAIACKKTNRKWICIEKELEYCEKSKKRIQEYV